MIYWESEWLLKKTLINLIIDVLKELQQVDRGDPVDIIYSKAFGKVLYKKLKELSYHRIGENILLQTESWLKTDKS